MHRILLAVGIFISSGVMVVSSSTSSRALPVAPIDILGDSAISEQGLVEKTHGWHCDYRHGWYRYYRHGRLHRRRGRHRHRRDCEGLYFGYYYGPYIYFGPPRLFYRGHRRGRRYTGRRYRRGHVFVEIVDAFAATVVVAAAGVRHLD